MHDETLLDYAIYDAVNNGFGKVVFVIRKDIEADFRERLFDRIARNCNAEYVFQSLDSLLTAQQQKLAVNRKKPWGTVHAVLCAKSRIHEPFAIINADDYYGRSAYQTMATHLSTVTPDSSDYAMVGYVLENTMSKSGSVSRGVCKIENGMLVSMHEHTNISYTADKGEKGIVSVQNGVTEALTGKETVSMNLFGFTPNAFTGFEHFFNDFISENAASEKTECLLPESASMLVNKGLGNIKCYTTTERWFGMTYPEDRIIVKNEIAQKIKEGYYPEFLWK